MDLVQNLEAELIPHRAPSVLLCLVLNFLLRFPDCLLKKV